MFWFTVTVTFWLLVHPLPSWAVAVYKVVVVGETTWELPLSEPGFQVHEKLKFLLNLIMGFVVTAVPVVLLQAVAELAECVFDANAGVYAETVEVPWARVFSWQVWTIIFEVPSQLKVPWLKVWRLKPAAGVKLDWVKTKVNEDVS